MKSYFVRMTVGGAFLFSLLFVWAVAFAQTADQGAIQPPTEQAQTSPPSSPPPSGEAGTMPPPPQNFSGEGDSRAPLPPNGSFQNQEQNNFRPPQDGQFNQQGQTGFQKPPQDQFRRGGEQGQPINFQENRDGGFAAPSKPSMMPGADMQERIRKESMMNGQNFQGQQERERNFGQDGEDDWEARQQKMEEEQRKREEQMIKRQAAQMAKNLQQNVNSINKRVARLTKVGVRLTAECSEVITTLTDAAAKVKNAITREDLEDARDVMQSMEDINECRQIIERLINAPRMLKNAATAIKNLKKKKVDVSQVEPMLAALTTRFGTFKTGNPTNEDIEAFFDEMDSLGDTMAPLMGKPKNSMQGASVLESLGVWNTFKSWFGF